jgi:hypothetical protein
MITARNITTAKQIASVKVRNASNVLKGIASMKVRNTSNILKTVFSPSSNLAVNVPAFVYGAQSSGSAVDVTTEIATAIPTGGTAPYTYSWARTDGFGGTWTIFLPNNAQTAFRASSVAAGDSALAIFVCTVTDARGNTVDSIAINATADNFGGFA